ncbi:MAG: hypothetical protein V3R51_00850, partial [Gammaproteobacteria bacterium]
ALGGLLSVGFLSEVGTTQQDSLVSLFPLISLLIILSSINSIKANQRTAIVAIIFAGILAGLGCGLKLVIAVYALALCLSFFVLPVSWFNRFKFSVIFSIAVLFGLLVSGGYWMYNIWSQFGNPIFPQFNHIFHGELANPEPILDIRFLPRSLFEKIFYPVIFTANPSRVNELGYKQISWLVLYIAVIFFLANRLVHSFRHTSVYRTLVPEAKFLIAFLCFGYLLWLNIFGIYRYLVPLELLIPLILFVVITTLFESNWARVSAILLIGSITIINLRGVLDYGHSAWTDQVYRADARELKKPGPAAVILAGQPLAWIIPALDIRVPFIQVAPNFPVSEAYWLLARTMLYSRSGKIYIVRELDNPSIVKRTDSGLDNIGLAVDSNTCKVMNAYLGTTKFQYSYCELKKGKSENENFGS